MNDSRNKNRTDQKEILVGPPVVLPLNSPDRVFVRKSAILDIEDGSQPKLPTPFGIGSGGGSSVGSDPNLPIAILDIPQLTDIENVTYVQYFDAFNSIRIKAIVKIRNSSKVKDNVIGVDARNEPKGGSIVSAVPSGFVAPSPSTPSVKFDRNGTAIAWGWNNSTGLGSYSTVSYEWQIRSNDGTTSTPLNSGFKNYVPDSTSIEIGDSEVYKDYRVSSGQNDTAATSSSRWLIVRAVVLATDGKTYYSRYSEPI